MTHRSGPWAHPPRRPRPRHRLRTIAGDALGVAAVALIAIAVLTL